MAFSYTNIQTQKLFSVFFLLLATNVNSQKTVSFDFPKFTPGQSGITLQKNALILSDGTLALTNRTQIKNNTGRALYSNPVPIWDSATGNVASFVTSFSFVIDFNSAGLPVDGLIFFLAPDTVIPSNSDGGGLGVFDTRNAFNQFVGVEFDNYVNPEWDPDYGTHIGIDVNSLISLKTKPWNLVSKSLVKVDIIYDARTKILSVVVTDEIGQISTIAQIVDLKAVLPETVRIGLSASASGSKQRHTVYSWSFTSTFDTTTSTTSDDII